MCSAYRELVAVAEEEFRTAVQVTPGFEISGEQAGSILCAAAGWPGRNLLSHVPAPEGKPGGQPEAYPASITVYREECGTGVRGGYLASDRMTSGERLAVDRTHLARNEGWPCGPGCDFCPECRGNDQRRAEWDGREGSPDGTHGTLLTRRGRLLAGARDATFLRRSDTRTVKALHVLIVSERYAVAGGTRSLAAACDPVHIAVTAPFIPAHEAGDGLRCRRAACRRLFGKADKETADQEAAGPGT